MGIKKKKKAKTPGMLGDNRKARFLYSIEDSLECGVVLKGTEVKSLKSAHFNFSDAFVEVIDQELWLRNFMISAYTHGGVFNHEDKRPRKLLAHKREIIKLERRVKEKGYSLIPLKCYLKQGRVKFLIALGRGKKMADKRELIKNRDLQRDLDRQDKNR